MASMARKLNLKYIIRTSFQRSERTNFERLTDKKHITLGDSDVVLFVSSGSDQLIFLNRPFKAGPKKFLYDSRRLRLTKGGWDPLFLLKYAEQVGIKLIGLDRLKALFDKKLRKAATAR